MSVIVIDLNKKVERNQKELTAVEFVKKLQELEKKARVMGIDSQKMGTCYCNC